MGRIPTTLALLAIAMPAMAQAPTVTQTADSLAVAVGEQTLSVSLADAELRLQAPSGQYTLTPSLQLGDGWTRPARAEEPKLTRRDGALRAEIVYPVPEERRFALRIDAYPGLNALFVRSRLEVLDSARGQYYFWQTNASPDHFLSPSPQGIDSSALDTAAWAPLPWREWWFLPAGEGGLAVLPTNVGGRAPGPAGGVFLHALPRSAVIAPGDSLDAAFGLAVVKDAEEAGRIADEARERGLWPAENPKPAWEYGRPAPKWLREAEVYNLYYRPAAQWTDEIVEKQLRGFPFISGSTPDRAALER
ncbi:MAG: hypothetical protein FJX75_18235, partial [Armatimonadetes bacterium]|nr:hypothetical protein [Armatimonadota bacterium]